jgi:ATP-dependent DNA helicase RecQ
MTVTQVNVIKTVLIDQGIIIVVLTGNRKIYESRFGAPELSTKIFEQQRRQKLIELDKMIKYVDIKDCRMNYLCEFLGDEPQSECGKCDNDTGISITPPIPDSLKQKLIEFKEGFYPVLEVETTKSNLTNGVAASFYGFSRVGETVHNCKYEKGGEFPDFLVSLTLKAYRNVFGVS